jgi:hypothetical protein
MKGGRIYTLQPYQILDGHFVWKRHPHFKWKGFCDGSTCGLFRTKKEFEEFVDLEPDAAPYDPACNTAFTEERYQAWKGHEILHALTQNLKKQKKEREK